MLPSTTRIHGDYTITTMPFQQRNGKFSARFFAVKNQVTEAPIPISVKLPIEFEYESADSFETIEGAIDWITEFANNWVDDRAK